MPASCPQRGLSAQCSVWKHSTCEVGASRGHPSSSNCLLQAGDTHQVAKGERRGTKCGCHHCGCPWVPYASSSATAPLALSTTRTVQSCAAAAGGQPWHCSDTDAPSGGKGPTETMRVTNAGNLPGTAQGVPVSNRSAKALSHPGGTLWVHPCVYHTESNVH